MFYCYFGFGFGFGFRWLLIADSMGSQDSWLDNGHKGAATRRMSNLPCLDLK